MTDFAVTKDLGTTADGFKVEGRANKLSAPSVTQTRNKKGQYMIRKGKGIRKDIGFRTYTKTFPNGPAPCKMFRTWEIPKKYSKFKRIFDDMHSMGVRTMEEFRANEWLVHVKGQKVLIIPELVYISDTHSYQTTANNKIIKTKLDQETLDLMGL